MKSCIIGHAGVFTGKTSPDHCRVQELPMTEIILHHYEMSPVSELVRAALGYRQLGWHSVQIPWIAPKPDLTPLTGGYRKTPVLQIGADIYCDSARIIDALEAHTSGPTLYPQPLGDMARPIAHWFNTVMFRPAVVTSMGPSIAMLPKEFIEDRKKLFGANLEAMAPAAPHMETQWRAGMAWIEAAISTQPFVSGAAPGLADFAAYMDVWFVARDPAHAAAQRLFQTHPYVRGWYERISALGHGTRQEIAAGAALEIAARAEPREPTCVAAGQTFALGDTVAVLTEDPGADPVVGILHRLTDRDVSVLRDDPQVGTVAVHFPRLGYVVKAA
jgi:glutathione S-transferase